MKWFLLLQGGIKNMIVDHMHWIVLVLEPVLGFILKYVCRPRF